MKTNVKPLGDRILVTKHDLATKTDTGIILSNPLEIVGGILTGTAESIGSSVAYVKEQDTVWFSANSGVKFEKDGKNYLLLREAEILMHSKEE